MPSSWNVDLLEELLEGYPDKQFIVDHVKFGWPIDVNNVEYLDEIPKNQKGACDNPLAVDSYLKKEISRGAIIGPFAENPFNTDIRLSLLDAIPKRDSDELRIILNLSYLPEQGSVNEACNKSRYLGKPMNLRYPGVG